MAHSVAVWGGRQPLHLRSSPQCQAGGANRAVTYLWRAVDHEGEVLESFVTKRRDRKAALKFLRKIMKRHGRAQIFVTDMLRSYGAAMKVIGNVDR